MSLRLVSIKDNYEITLIKVLDTCWITTIYAQFNKLLKTFEKMVDQDALVNLPQAVGAQCLISWGDVSNLDISTVPFFQSDTLPTQCTEYDHRSTVTPGPQSFTEKQAMASKALLEISELHWANRQIQTPARQG